MTYCFQPGIRTHWLVVAKAVENDASSLVPEYKPDHVYEPGMENACQACAVM